MDNIQANYQFIAEPAQKANDASKAFKKEAANTQGVANKAIIAASGFFKGIAALAEAMIHKLEISFLKSETTTDGSTIKNIDYARVEANELAEKLLFEAADNYFSSLSR